MPKAGVEEQIIHFDWKTAELNSNCLKMGFILLHKIYLFVPHDVGKLQSQLGLILKAGTY